MKLAHPCNVIRSVKTSALSRALESHICKARTQKEQLATVAADVIRSLVVIASTDTLLSPELAKQALQVARNVEDFL